LGNIRREDIEDIRRQITTLRYSNLDLKNGRRVISLVKKNGFGGMSGLIGSKGQEE
jgi:hypothetical protein